MSSVKGRFQRSALTVVLGVVGLTACSSDVKNSSVSSVSSAVSLPATSTTQRATATTVPESTTTVPAAPTWPLSGLTIVAPATATRPALVVKIDNHPLARPQSGLNEADIVFEENVEQLTRFAAVFHSLGAETVGPVRSGRTQDIALLGSFNRPLFAWSGGNRRVTDAIQGSDLRQLSALQQKVFARNRSRKGPHDLYSSTDKLFALAPPDAGPPQPQFTYRSAGAPVAGEPTEGVNVSMDGVKVSWRWDPSKSLFLRQQDSKVHRDTIGDAQVSTDNVVVLYVTYKPSPADAHSPEAQTIGKGDVLVFSAGKLVKGTWSRAERLQPFTLKDASGQVIELTPGRTFVELGRTRSAAPVPAGTDPKSVPFP